MSRTIRMDASGRVVIPLIVRERFGVAGGSYQLELSESPEGILLRPRAEEIPVLRHESGWVVFQSGAAETVDPVAAVEEAREHRHGEVVDARPPERAR